jgi:triosephosphate isomerase (TIM)
MRKKIVAGNWKMNPDAGAARRLAESVWGETNLPWNHDVVLIPPAVYLGKFTHLFPQIEQWHWGAQDCSLHGNGAFTGEISASMLRSLGVQYVIIGHSERRQYFGEDSSLLAAKIDAALEQGLTPIFCCGEPLPVREENDHIVFVKTQLEESLWHLSAAAFAHVVIAYEPVWAIGTGKTASPAQAQEVHAAIRAAILAKYGRDLADALPILYGGSCNPSNAAELFAQPDIDGGLIGGASLVAEDFHAIIQALPHE